MFSFCCKVVTGFCVFGTTQNDSRSLLGIVQRIVFIETYGGIIIIENSLISPFSFPMTSLFLVSRIIVPSFVLICLFWGNVTFGRPLFCDLGFAVGFLMGLMFDKL
jgi:hypothetical protein